MKLVITKDQLIQGLQAVQNVVSSRTTLPILSNVFLQAAETKLALTATDLDVTITCTVEAKVERAGGTTLPVKKLFGIARELAASEVELDIDEKNVCSLRAGASFYKINGLSAEEFPPKPGFSELRKVTVDQEKLKGMLKKTSFAISTDETRFVLNGVFVSFKGQKMTLVATDGRRLALAEQEVEIPEEGQGEFIVPTKAVNELNRLLQAGGQVEIKTNENQVSFLMSNELGGSVVVVSKLVEGNYPNYRQVIPSETLERVALGREELLQAVRRAEIMTSDKSNSVKLAFTNNNLAITANAPEVGEARESLAVNYKGKDVAIAFNPIYLMDPLKALEDDEVFLELIDELSPGVLKVKEPFLYVLMPMRMS